MANEDLRDSISIMQDTKRFDSMDQTLQDIRDLIARSTDVAAEAARVTREGIDHLGGEIVNVVVDAFVKFRPKLFIRSR